MHKQHDIIKALNANNRNVNIENTTLSPSRRAPCRPADDVWLGPAPEA